MTQAIYHCALPEGTFVAGVPAHDLTPAEWSDLDPDTQKILLEMGWYVLEIHSEIQPDTSEEKE